MTIKPYDREKAVLYAKYWAKRRNPAYYDFDGVGGDCTNFISQCVYAGSEKMNYTPITGWFYINSTARTASWTSVEYFYRFIVGNLSVGPFGRLIDQGDAELGDVIQLGSETGDFYHSLIISGFSDLGPLVCAHTVDALNRPLRSYYYARARFIHIEGVRI
ncbi:MAG: amidase domain-containing protein [Clostridia bacterium]|nr:amidase domain-containing protein [Clostridia bacterium]